MGFAILLPFNALNAANSCPNPSLNDNEEVEGFIHLYSENFSQEFEELKVPRVNEEMTNISSKKKENDDKEEHVEFIELAEKLIPHTEDNEKTNKSSDEESSIQTASNFSVASI